MADNAILQAIEKPGFLDKAAEPLHDDVKKLLDRVPALRDALHGTWLGHPLHAALVGLPVGAFTVAFIFDLFEVLGHSKKYRGRADAVIAVGLAGALPAALAGIADWTTTAGAPERVGFAHGLANSAVASLYGASLYARAKRERTLGIALSTAAYGVLTLSAWLGGELAYRFGVGQQPAPSDRPKDRADSARPEQAPAS